MRTRKAVLLPRCERTRELLHTPPHTQTTTTTEHSSRPRRLTADEEPTNKDSITKTHACALGNSPLSRLPHLLYPLALFFAVVAFLCDFSFCGFAILPTSVSFQLFLDLNMSADDKDSASSTPAVTVYSSLGSAANVWRQYLRPYLLNSDMYVTRGPFSAALCTI